jgi:hypothetical protein
VDETVAPPTEDPVAREQRPVTPRTVQSSLARPVTPTPANGGSHICARHAATSHAANANHAATNHAANANYGERPAATFHAAAHTTAQG